MLSLRPDANGTPHFLKLQFGKGMFQKMESSYVVPNFIGWIKLIFNAVYNFVVTEFHLTYKVQNIKNRAFQNGLFTNAQIPNRWVLKGGMLLSLCYVI